MKITTKHRIAYKAKDAPGEPVEMALYQDEYGTIYAAVGEPVSLNDGVPDDWVQELIEGTSQYWEGYLIPPPFEPYVGMVVESVNDPSSIWVCYIDTDSQTELSWISTGGLYRSHPEIASRVKKGVLRVREVEHG